MVECPKRDYDAYAVPPPEQLRCGPSATMLEGRGDAGATFVIETGRWGSGRGAGVTA
jgi:hypothetical protein